MSLHEMMDVHDEKLLNLVQNYRIHLIDPSAMSEKELEKFTSSLREVLSFIKYSEDPDKLASYVEGNPRMNLEREAAMVIKTVTNVPLNLSKQEERVDMCKAIEIMLNESRETGRREGRSEGEREGRREGRSEGKLIALAKVVYVGKLTVPDAAELAGMTEEEFLKSCEKFKQELY